MRSSHGIRSGTQWFHWFLFSPVWCVIYDSLLEEAAYESDVQGFITGALFIVVLTEKLGFGKVTCIQFGAGHLYHSFSRSWSLGL